MTIFFNFQKYDELRKSFRETWDTGPTAAFEGVYTFHSIIKFLKENTYYTIKEIIFKFCIENSDLANLSPDKLISFLDYEYKISYKKGL
jgi:hypothetical protein